MHEHASARKLSLLFNIKEYEIINMSTNMRKSKTYINNSYRLGVFEVIQNNH